MADYVATVDPDDGGADYSTLAAAEAGEQKNLGSAHTQRIECTAISGTADTAEVVINGWTTNPDHELTIVTPEASRHQAVWDSDLYTLEVTGGTYGAIANAEEFVNIEGLQVAANGDENSLGVLCLYDPGSGSIMEIDSCIFLCSIQVE